MASSLLIDEHPVLFQPSLATMIGVSEAIITQQLHFLLGMPRSGRMHEGERWIYNTYEEWRRQYFPFWTVQTIRRLFIELEKMNIVISDQPEGRYSRRKYYRLNRGMITKLIRENLPDSPHDSEPELDSDDLKIRRSGKVSKLDVRSAKKETFLNAETSVAKKRLLCRKALKAEHNPIETSSPNHHPIARPPLPPADPTFDDE